METFTLSLPLSNEYLTTVRLAVGGLCALKGFDVDSSEDYKVCVTESLLILKRNGYRAAVIEFSLAGEELTCTALGKDGGGEISEGPDDEISYALLDALIGNAVFEKDGARVCKISFSA